MVWVSLTRLRLRSVRFLPGFSWRTWRTLEQVKRAEGFLGGSLLPDHDRTFWTMTAWTSREAMLAYMTAGDHKRVMPKLMTWCDEASVAHWEQEDAVLPGWDEADRRMRATGRASKVKWPSAGHDGLRYREARTTQGVVVRPRGGG